LGVSRQFIRQEFERDKATQFGVLGPTPIPPPPSFSAMR
jgi:hypothetical protein